jgi:hypothetical protein
MTSAPQLLTGTIVHHSHYGKGKIVCQYDDSNIGDMVEVHWLDKNEVLDHREENLRFGLTNIQPPDTSKLSPWLALIEEN